MYILLRELESIDSRDERTDVLEKVRNCEYYRILAYRIFGFDGRAARWPMDRKKKLS